ncbi:MAG: PQQ-binding-like beta-propeller repeat protein [Fervidobacterium sp.]|uniref:PQQ-binding-like beta-propeller repeat protein n=1 Tax=Fervidobacterium TaxID=2422 RepID=UPI001FE758D3|nr:PQQ-binding-like beta-propeller repeat protein [Fervidobacterium gondwanense]
MFVKGDLSFKNARGFAYLIFFTYLFFLSFSNVFAGALLVSGNGIYDESGNLIKSLTVNDLLFDGTEYYYIQTDGIYTLDGKTKIDIKNAQRVGLNYVLANLKVYKISKGNATTIGTVSSKMKSIYVQDDYIIGIEGNQIVCYFQDKIVWSISTSASSIKVSGSYLAVFDSQTQLFNISNPKYIKLERVYPKFKDYVFFDIYHVFADDSKIYFYRGNARLSTTFPYKGALLTDGTFLYSGTLVISSELTQKELKFSVKSLVPVPSSSETDEGEKQIVQIPSTQQTTIQTTPQTTTNKETETSEKNYPSQEKPSEPEPTIVKPTVTQPVQKTPKLYELVWKVVLSDDVFGKPAVKDNVAYVPTLKGNLLSISNGKINWTYKASFVVVGHVTVGEHIYLASWDDNIYAVDEKGSLKWKLALDGDISQGPAWDGYYLYVVTDNGTVYVLKDNIRNASIVSSYRTASYPVVPPSVSLSGKIFVVDGVGNLWRDKSVQSFVGKVKNLPVVSETPYISQQLGFTLYDDMGVSYEFVPMVKETQILRGKSVFMTINEEVTDAVVSKEKLYIMTSSGKLLIIDKSTKKTLFSDTVPNGKYISLSNGYLYAFGKEVRSYYVNDTPAGFWNSLFANPLNWNSGVK